MDRLTISLFNPSWRVLYLIYTVWSILTTGGQSGEETQHVATSVKMGNPNDIIAGCPRQVDVTVHLPQGDSLLNLDLSEKYLYKEIPVYVSHGGQWVPYPNIPYQDQSDDPCFYQDVSQDAGFSIHFTGDNHKLRGVFHTQNTSYTIQPSKSQGLHTVTTRPNHDSYLTHNEIRIRRKRQTQSKYTVEMLAVVDFPIYKRWFTVSKAGQVSERDQRATNMIKYYFTHILHEVDLRYKSIQESDFTMGVVLSGIYIAKSSSSLSFEESLAQPRTGQRDGLKASDVLEKMETWVTQITTNLQYDHVMLFTGYDLYETAGGTDHYNKIGSAYLEGICRLQNRVSVVEDQSDFTSALTAAHELGHSLGAQHDGYGNICDSSDQYVMASTVETRTDENIFRFSSCSINAFRTWARYLSRQRRNCMTNEGVAFNKTAVDIYLSTLPGSRYTLTQQCKLIYGDQSYFCGGQENAAAICEKLVCYKPNDGACYILGGKPAFRGTSCGNKKWCDARKCVYNENAPVLPENCTFGDSPTGVQIGGQKLNCSSIVNLSTDLCYHGDFHDICCGSCDEAKDKDRPECPYGDRVSGCYNLNKEDCRTHYNDCCGSCHQYETGIPGCRFGDERSWCPSISRRQCYQPDGARCCETCHKYKVNITDCEYGDKIANCNKGLCTDSHYERNCCETCLKSTTTSTTTEATTTTTTTPTTSTSTSISTVQDTFQPDGSSPEPTSKASVCLTATCSMFIGVLCVLTSFLQKGVL